MTNPDDIADASIMNNDVATQGNIGYIKDRLNDIKSRLVALELGQIVLDSINRTFLRLIDDLNKDGINLPKLLGELRNLEELIEQLVREKENAPLTIARIATLEKQVNALRYYNIDTASSSPRTFFPTLIEQRALANSSVASPVRSSNSVVSSEDLVRSASSETPKSASSTSFASLPEQKSPSPHSAGSTYFSSLSENSPTPKSNRSFSNARKDVHVSVKKTRQDQNARNTVNSVDSTANKTTVWGWVKAKAGRVLNTIVNHPKKIGAFFVAAAVAATGGIAMVVGGVVAASVKAVFTVGTFIAAKVKAAGTVAKAVAIGSTAVLAGGVTSAFIKSVQSVMTKCSAALLLVRKNIADAIRQIKRSSTKAELKSDKVIEKIERLRKAHTDVVIQYKSCKSNNNLVYRDDFKHDQLLVDLKSISSALNCASTILNKAADDDKVKKFRGHQFFWQKRTHSATALLKSSAQLSIVKQEVEALVDAANIEVGKSNSKKIPALTKSLISLEKRFEEASSFNLKI